MRTPLIRTAALVALLACGAGAQAQQVERLDPASVPPDMVHSAESSPGGMKPVDLGQEFSGAPGAAIPAGAPAAASAGTATRAAAAARSQVRTPPASAEQQRFGVERELFDRAPVRVALPVGQERLITLPAPAALHVPSDMASVARLEVIDRTIYATALVPFTPIRIVAELVDSGQQIPMDLVAGKDTAGARAQLEISTVTSAGAGGAVSASAAPEAARDEAAPTRAPERKPVDMVELTRHAARQLYAPQRLAWATPGVQQIEVDSSPVEDLIAGVNVETIPVGQWRGGKLYVTAVKVRNLSRFPLEIPLEAVRGHWISAAAQHGRVGAAGTETDTTAIYLVCDRAFDSCR